MHRQAQVRVIIADDHPVLRKGLRTVLDLESTIEVLGEVASFRELETLLETTSADVVLLDLGGMWTQPVTAISVLTRTYRQLGVIIYSSTLSGARELLKAAARGYVAKEDVEDEVVAAIHTIMRGHLFLSQTVTNYLDRAGGMRKKDDLAPQEWNVLRLIAEEFGTRDVAT